MKSILCFENILVDGKRLVAGMAVDVADDVADRIIDARLGVLVDSKLVVTDLEPIEEEAEAVSEDAVDAPAEKQEEPKAPAKKTGRVKTAKRATAPKGDMAEAFAPIPEAEYGAE